jgi:hypothetical protein
VVGFLVVVGFGGVGPTTVVWVTVTVTTPPPPFPGLVVGLTVGLLVGGSGLSPLVVDVLGGWTTVTVTPPRVIVVVDCANFAHHQYEDQMGGGGSGTYCKT